MKIQKRKFLIKCQNQKLKQVDRMDNNCHISDLEQTFSYVENGRLNLVLKLDKHLTCIIGASNSIILPTVCKQNKQT